MPLESPLAYDMCLFNLWIANHILIMTFKRVNLCTLRLLLVVTSRPPLLPARRTTHHRPTRGTAEGRPSLLLSQPIRPVQCTVRPSQPLHQLCMLKVGVTKQLTGMRMFLFSKKFLSFFTQNYKNKV